MPAQAFLLLLTPESLKHFPMVGVDKGCSRQEILQFTGCQVSPNFPEVVCRLSGEYRKTQRLTLLTFYKVCTCHVQRLQGIRDPKQTWQSFLPVPFTRALWPRQARCRRTWKVSREGSQSPETTRQCKWKSESAIRGKQEARGGEVGEKKEEWARAEQGTEEQTPFFWGLFTAFCSAVHRKNLFSLQSVERILSDVLESLKTMLCFWPIVLEHLYFLH